MPRSTVSVSIAGVMLSLLMLASLTGCRDESEAAPSATANPLSHSAPAASAAKSTQAAVPGALHFTSKIARSGIDFVHITGDSEVKPFPAANGSGVAAWDFDRDGLHDLYFATGNLLPATMQPGDASNRCYRNLGDWTFQEVTSLAGLGHNGFSAGVAVGDYDSDGFPDLYVGCYGRNVLYRNEGDGTFTDVAQSAGADDDRWATSSAFFDWDADGLLDLYVGNYAKWTLDTNHFCGDRERGHRMFCGPTTVPPEDDVLFWNAGDGRFENASERTGISYRANRTQGVLAADLNQDGWTDLYLGNDQNPNSLFLNQRDGTFRDDAELVNVAYDKSGKAQAGMGVTMADVDRNGAFDLFVTNYENENNSLYEDDGTGFYQEISAIRGLAAPSLPYIGWGTHFADFDLDGWHDLVVVNGHTDNNLAELGRDGSFDQPAHAFHNVNGRFELVGPAAGEYFASLHPARAMAIADFDNDGDWDVVCGHQDAAPELLANDHIPQGSPPAAVWLTLVGTRSNRDAIGATVIAESDGRPILEQITSGGSYLSDSQRAVVLVRSESEAADWSVTIRWPGGRECTAGPLPQTGRYLIIEPVDEADRTCRVIPQAP